MEPPIKADIFIVPVEDHTEAIATLESSDTPYCTFPHNVGGYMAIAVATGNKKKRRADPPDIPPFERGE